MSEKEINYQNLMRPIIPAGAIAAGVSYAFNHSILYSIGHFFLGYAYLAYKITQHYIG